MTKPKNRWINAVAVLPAAARKLFGQKRTRTGGRALVLGICGMLLILITATDARAQLGVTLNDLVSKPWQMALVGKTGCGQTSMLFTGFLSPKSGILTTSSPCGFSSSTQTFTITSLSSTGAGTANLTCGSGCGWNFDFQVNNLWTMDLVDVVNGGNNVLAGTAIAQGGGTLPAFPLSQLAGTWQIDLAGNTGCGHASMVFLGTLNASGSGTGTLTSESGCGPSSSTQTFTITQWNPATSTGTAALTCGSGCGWSFNIQLDVGATTFNLVDVMNGSNNVLAGTGIQVPEGATYTLQQLAGPWRIALVGNTGCGVSAMEFTGTLNTTGTATGILKGSSGCGSSSSLQTFTITSFNFNGSGTANLTCGPGCGWNFEFQVDAYHWTFNLVDVTNGPGNVLGGTGIAGYVMGS